VTESPLPTWFAACPKGIESLLAHELSTLGAQSTRETVAGVYFEGPAAIAYRACLWSRLANRILMPLQGFPVTDAESLYNGLREMPWNTVFKPSSTLAIDFLGQNDAIRNTQFGAQKSKDAIVDWFVDHGGVRPSVDRKNPGVRLNLRLVKSKLHVSLDFSGGSLHRRGYRRQAGEAPLKENLAAALLLRADWPGIAARGGALIDPMCGSATLLLEGALMVADIAPGLRRTQFGFEHWLGHNAEQWRMIRADAQVRAEQGRSRQLPEIRGYDADPRVIRAAQQNIASADLEKVIRVSCKSLSELKKPSHISLDEGLIICNPPYGERLGEKASLSFLYQQLGEAMAREFQGWQAAVFTADLDLGRAVGLRSHKRYTLWNGALESSLLLFELKDNAFRPSVADRSQSVAAPAGEQQLSEGASMFGNRIRKNRKRLASWVKREGISCYRLYDADMPEYAVAVDIYDGHAHVAEYRAPKDVAEEAAVRRLAEITAALPGALAMPEDRIVYKQRSRQRGAGQYQKQDSRGELLTVREGEVKLLVNLHDYIDTGLFLDHRPLRLRLAAQSPGKDFLNLFCYTGSATVHAAMAGARSTTSVDTSNTYLAWLRKNLAVNGLAEIRNHVVRADCREWLEDIDEQYDLIMLDPPSFSNTSGAAADFDVQRDHLSLLALVMQRLRPAGSLYFSNNRRGFKLDPQVEQDFDCTDITRQTLDPDFQRNARIHQCWHLQHARIS